MENNSDIEKSVINQRIQDRIKEKDEKIIQINSEIRSIKEHIDLTKKELIYLKTCLKELDQKIQNEEIACFKEILSLNKELHSHSEKCSSRKNSGN